MKKKAKKKERKKDIKYLEAPPSKLYSQIPIMVLHGFGNLLSHPDTLH
jgi:hypothetical protein